MKRGAQARVRAKMSPMAVVVPTLKALAAPRRSIPLALFGVMCIAVETLSARDRASAALFTLALYFAFVVLGPLSWCVYGHTILGRVVHGLNGILCSFLFGVLMRKLWLPETTLLTDPTGLVALTGGFWVGGHSVGRDIELERALGQAEREREQALREATHAQLLALRAHFDPHFLFNTLNAIAEWCREAPEVAEQATLRLSDMLRAILTAVKHPTWRLDRELELIEHLFALYAARDPQRFVLKADVADATRGVQVPPLLLLTLAENAIKHGPAAGHRGPVLLEARLLAGGVLCLRVKNPGQYQHTSPDGDGLSVLRQRVAHVKDSRANFVIQGDDGFTVSELRLPHSEEPSHA